MRMAVRLTSFPASVSVVNMAHKVTQISSISDVDKQRLTHIKSSTEGESRGSIVAILKLCFTRNG